MKHKKSFAHAAVCLGLFVVPGESAYALRVDRVVGVTSSGGSCLVKRFTVSAGQVVVGAEIVTSDLRTVFPRVALLAGDGRALGDLRRAAEVRNVHSASRHVVQVVVPPIVVDESRDIYVAVELPPNTGARAVGDGPGLGAMTAGSGNCYIASADDGMLQPLDVDLCIRLVFQGAGKAEAAGVPSGPDRVSIEASPNPFNPTTSVTFGVPSRSIVTLSIYSVSGRVIRSLTHEELPAGSYSREWDGRDEGGRLVSGGVYIARLQVDDTIVTRRLILLK